LFDIPENVLLVNPSMQVRVEAIFDVGDDNSDDVIKGTLRKVGISQILAYTKPPSLF
jgi:hypothetical protein